MRIGQGECPEFEGTLLSNSAIVRAGNAQAGAAAGPPSNAANPTMGGAMRTDHSAYGNGGVGALPATNTNRGLSGMREKVCFRG